MSVAVTLHECVILSLSSFPGEYLRGACVHKDVCVLAYPFASAETDALSRLSNKSYYI